VSAKVSNPFTVTLGRCRRLGDWHLSGAGETVERSRGGRVVALGKFRETVAGVIKPRTVMILVEWTSKEAFDGYRNDANIADLHPHREKGACDYIWQLFDKLEDLRPILK